jgi:acyl carrier protein
MHEAPFRLSPGGSISGIVDKMLTQKGLASAEPGRDLRDAGLSSMDMVNLMLAIEDDFDILLPQAEMTPENFRTVETIEALVMRLV